MKIKYYYCLLLDTNLFKMPLIYLGLGILLMFVLLLVFRFNAFFSLLITSIFVGVLNEMSIADTLQSVLNGIGNTILLVPCWAKSLKKAVRHILLRVV